MKNLNFIVQQIKEIFSPVNFIGYSITGSTLINLEDDQSDIDLIIILENINKPYLSNLISFYDYTMDQYTEVLVEDIYDWIDYDITEFYGYRSWVNYLINKRKPIFADDQKATKYNLTKVAINKYSKLWFHLMLLGYQDSLTKVIDSLTTGSFNNLFRKYAKETYHLCYTFTELYNIKADPTLIKYLKRNNLNLLNYSQQAELLTILKTIKDHTIPKKELLKEQFEIFQSEIKNIWK